MRCYSLSMIVILSVLVWGGCGARKAVPVDTLDGRAVGELVRLEGRLSSHGSSPFPVLVLELDDGGVVLLESKTVKEELRRLADMRVAVEGDVSQPMGERRVLEVVRYELVRLPSGELPLIGSVSFDGDHCILRTREGKRYWLRGDLVKVLAEYAGARVWVTGTLDDPGDAGAPRGAAPYWVIGYGVLAEAGQ